MPLPTDIRLFARTADIDSPQKCRLMTEKEIGEFIKYHSSSSKELNNDALHGTFFQCLRLEYSYGASLNMQKERKILISRALKDNLNCQ